jgi:opacity protein-like surface antigen
VFAAYLRGEFVKKNITLISMVVLFALVASAQQDVPRSEAYLGFQFVRANQFNQNLGLAQSIGGFSMYGGDGQFIYNFNRWISAVGDFGAVNKPNVGIINAQNTTAFAYGGPRFYFRKHRLSPFAQVLFGGAFRHVSTEVTALTSVDTPNLPVVSPSNLFPGPLAVVTARLTNTDNAFSMKAGGGVDYRLNKHFSVRAVEVDYVLTRFPSLSTGARENQNSIAASAGIIFTFGEQ